MVKELHLYLEFAPDCLTVLGVCTTFKETEVAIKQKKEVVCTTQTHFLSFKYAERLFVRVNGREYEITLGKCEGTSREIKVSHNLERLLFAGEFDWFEGESVFCE